MSGLVTMVPAIKGTSNRTISCKLHLYLRLDWPPVKSIILVFNQYIKVVVRDDHIRIRLSKKTSGPDPTHKTKPDTDPNHKKTGFGSDPQEKNRMEHQTG